MKGEPLNELPGWPAALNKKLAAAYCGLSSETFGAVCPVKPISFTGSGRGERYLRARIDEWLLSIDPNEKSFTSRPSLAERLYGKSSTRDRSATPGSAGALQFKGPSGYPIIDDPKDPVKRWYDKLGFDPRTMDQSDMARLQKEADKGWLESIPSKRLATYERTALAQLAEHGPNKRIPWKKVRNCGAATQERLEARGFLQVIMRTDKPTHLESYVLTDAGWAAWKQIERGMG